MGMLSEENMGGHADMMFGDWVYDEAPRESYDCNSLASRKDLNTFELSVLKACETALTRKRLVN